MGLLGKKKDKPTKSPKADKKKAKDNKKGNVTPPVKVETPRVVVDDVSLPFDGSPLTNKEILTRSVASTRPPKTFLLGSTPNGVIITLRYGYVCQRGYYPEDPYKENQDAFKITSQFDNQDKAPQILLGVFDGHGSEGDGTASFVRDNVEHEMQMQMKRDHGERHPAYSKSPVRIVTAGDVSLALKHTLEALSRQLHSSFVDDSSSGTTAIAAFFKGTAVTVANVGDSRAICAERKGEKVVATSLSSDQTPYRKDERERVKKCGAIIRSQAMIQGLVPIHDNWDVVLGEEIDGEGDPPRVFAKGSTGPGCAFTRSIGDFYAEKIGVIATPELTTVQLHERMEFIVLASDGVWEFLTNQTVVDMVLPFTEPLEACRAVVAEAYRLWVQFEERTDDITMLLAFVDRDTTYATLDPEEEEDPEEAAKREELEKLANRPVRRGLSKEKRAAMAIAAQADAAEDDISDFQMEEVPKTPEQLARIKAAVAANFLFQHLSDAQRAQAYSALKPMEFKAGDVVIQQGDEGSWFYIVDAGDYIVTIDKGDGEAPAEILRYKPSENGDNPSFGELALMYSKPRAATVTASTDGLLWAMDRKSFRAILMKKSDAAKEQQVKTLRSVEILACLGPRQLGRLQDLLCEETFEVGAHVIRQGDLSQNLYIISEGRVSVTKSDRFEREGKDQILVELGQGQYFGERALLFSEPRAANVIALTPLKLLYISKEAFEEVLGPLQGIIDEDRKRREAIARKQQELREAEEFTTATGAEDFVLQGVSATVEPLQYALAGFEMISDRYSIKCAAKASVVSMGMAQRVIAEVALTSALLTSDEHRMIPFALLTQQDERFLYTVYKRRIATDLATVLGETPFDDAATMFYTAAAASALAHLHNHDLLYRNLTTDALVLDERGYVQLVDFRYACKTEPLPNDFCGYPHYLSPEQVSAQGHGTAADFWALGILAYEIATGGQNPWLTGNPSQDSEVDVYSRISSHEKGELAYPKDVTVSEPLKLLLDELLCPDDMARLDISGLLAAAFFEGFDWEALDDGKMAAPHAELAFQTSQDAWDANKKPEAKAFAGDAGLFASFSLSTAADGSFKDASK